MLINCRLFREAFVRIILDGQAMVCPVVAFYHGGAVELVINNNNVRVLLFVQRRLDLI